ncbi:phosphotransferase [Microbacterium sp. G2-8]|uniref:phosphotransferase n=1 Tax=Microbacterium sp. G2-8 TaxID=2842454 RepID=UPI001C8AD56D|nr:phosphotransferase [Microbacterium sp. G2-8]
MPDLDDQRILDADPSLASLGDVLSGAALARRLGVPAVRVAYVRYKPGVSAEAGVEICRADGRIVWARSVAHVAPGERKLARAARHADERDAVLVYDEERAWGVFADVADPALPGIASARADHPHASVLVYKPGRRWVARCDACGTIIKVHAPAAGERAATAHALAGAHLPTAAVTREDLARGIIETRLLPGGAPEPGDRDAIDAAGRALAHLHAAQAEISPQDLAGWRADREAEIAGALDAIAHVAPREIAAAQRIARAVRRIVGARDALAIVHGDFSIDQLIADGADLHVIDLDRARIGDPLADLACWAGDEIARGADVPSPPLVEAYLRAGGSVDHDDLRILTAGALLQRAVEPFRARRSGWEAEISRRLAVAVRLAMPSDEALPGLRPALALPGAELVVHRPGRRAVVRSVEAGKTRFVKVVRPSRADRVLDRARRVEHLRAVRTPQILWSSAHRGLIALTSVGERTLLELGGDPGAPDADIAAAWTTAGRAIGELQQLPTEALPMHGVAEELAATRRQLARAERVLPADVVTRAVDAVTRDLEGAPATDPVVLHRDLHDKQLLVAAERPASQLGLIDVDTLAAGEGAVDVANLLVHVELRELQGLLTPRRAALAREALETSVVRELPDAVRARIPAYARATRLRLAGVYGARPGAEEISRVLLGRALEEDPD